MNRIRANILVLTAFALCGGSISMAQTGVERDPLAKQAEMETATLRVNRGHIELTAMQGYTFTFHIYSIAGQLVKSVTVTSGSETIALPQGYYIVKCSEWSKKAVIR